MVDVIVELIVVFILLKRFRMVRMVVIWLWVIWFIMVSLDVIIKGLVVNEVKICVMIM